MLTYSYDDYVHVLCGDFNAYTLTMSDVPSDTAEDLVSVNLTDFGITETRANQDLTPDRNSYGKKVVGCL